MMRFKSMVITTVLALVVALGMSAAVFGAEASYDPSRVSERGLVQVYGPSESELADEDALVFTFFGDGFTAEEQDKFYEEAEKTAEYVMGTSPYDEFSDVIKFYALGTISNESGARGDTATTQEEADADTRDTFFGTSFWTGGMQRLVSVPRAGSKLCEALIADYNPESDHGLMIVNSTTYGGGGGEPCCASLNVDSFEMMIHEMGHSVSDLSDEYFAGESYASERYVNMTQESDPTKVKWARFVGRNGIGVYEYTDGGDGWYHPSKNCKMQYLGKQYEFCEVCKESQRQEFSKKSNVSKLFFQTYADRFYPSEVGIDMSQYFIIRKGANEATGDTLGSALTLTYYDSEGKALDAAPGTPGDYTVLGSFGGNDTYDACEVSGEYTIDMADLITLKVKTKVYDGSAIVPEYTVDYDKEYYCEEHYTGKVPYSANPIEKVYDYDSDAAPATPGSYTVTVTAYDKATGVAISKKSADFDIKFKTTAYVDNNDGKYPGATVYYNNKTIGIAGEGFTADEQKQFEKYAKQFANYLQNTDPLKETAVYFNISSIEAESKESGIGTEARDTYFKLYVDENGKIVNSIEADSAAKYLSYNQVTAYYKNTIVIVNDKDHVVKECTTSSASGIEKRIIYVTPDELGMEYAKNEVVNYLNGTPAGYVPATDEEKEAQRLQLLKALYYLWYGTDYAVITSRAYQEPILATGKPVDLEDTFTMYCNGNAADVDFTMTYYTNDKGKPGEQLTKAPKTCGTYFAKAEFIPEGGKSSQTVIIGDNSYNVPRSRGLVQFTICDHEDIVENVIPAKQGEDGALQEVCKSCGKVMGETQISGIAEVKASASAYTYNGKAQKPGITVTDMAGNVVGAENYDVKFSGGCVNVGGYKATVTFKGNYEGTASMGFKINPKKTYVKSLKPGKKTLKVSWYKQSLKMKSTRITGYQVRYSTSAKMTGAKYAKVKGYANTTKTFRKLKSGKKYYVQVRTYKTVNGVAYYSGWSKVRAAKVK